MAGVLQIPGYRFDGKKYFKIIHGSHPNLPPQIPSHDATSLSSSSLPKSKRRKVKPSLKGKERAFEPSTRFVRAMFETHPTSENERLKRKHNLESLAMSRLRLDSVISPGCLQTNSGESETITVLEFDSLDPSLLRIGGSSGSISSGSFSRARNQDVFFPNDELGWRSHWHLPSQITSIHTCGDRFVSTSFGSPAIFSSQSSGSINLSPSKTSLWSSALTPDLVALGCDKKVLVSKDPSRSAMEVFDTGGKGGDGAVFSLVLDKSSMIFAGTRRGEVKVFDLRSSSSRSKSNGVSKTIMGITSQSSIIHLERIRQNLLLVAGMNGSLDFYDLRYLTTPYIASGLGNVNQYTRDAGVAVKDDIVAIAGQDKRIRLYSILTGSPILSSPSTPSSTSTLLNRIFSQPIKALAFSPEDTSSHFNSSRSDLEKLDRRYQGEITLWVADGGRIECFKVV